MREIDWDLFWTWRWYGDSAFPRRIDPADYAYAREERPSVQAPQTLTRPAPRPIARPARRPRYSSSVETVKVTGRGAPFGQASAELFSEKHGHWLRWRFEPGCFAKWLQTDYDIGLCVGHDGEFDHELASRKAGTLFLAETAEGLAFTALVPVPEPALAGLRGRAQAVSIGFKIRESEIVIDRNWILPIESISNADVFHVALVPEGAFPGACCWLG